MSNLVHVKGLADLQKFMNQLPAKLEANVLRSALRAGANVVKKEAQRNIATKIGALRKSLKVSTRSRRGVVTATVKSSSFYARMVEYGTQAHFIRVKKESRPGRLTRRGYKKWSIRTINRSVARGSLMIGKNFVGESVSHPGARKKPFLRPALDSRAQDALVAVGNSIKQRLQTKHGLDTSSVEIDAV